MAIYIITGKYTAEAARGMMAHPSDRLAAVTPLVEAVGGKVLSYYVTMGPMDFILTCEGDDIEGIVAALLVAGGTGGVSDLCTMPAFTAAAFTAAQTRAGKIAAKFKSAAQG